MFTVGQLIKFKPEVIPADAKNDEFYGDLGAPGVFKWLVFEVLGLEKDDVRGDIIRARVANAAELTSIIPDLVEVESTGELVLLQKDVMLANSKLTIHYSIESQPSKQTLIANLFAEREVMKRQGLKRDHNKMRDNWNRIEILRGKRSGVVPELSGTVKVEIMGSRIKVDVNTNELPDGSEESEKKFQQLLASKLRTVRQQRKQVKIETKQVFGTQLVKKQGGVFTESNSLLKAYEEMMKTTLETDKKPTDPKATFVGIEIEIIYKGNYAKLKELLIASKLHRFVTLKDDGSLRACHNTGYQHKEITVICKTTEVEDVLKRLDAVLLNPAIDGYANRSCGLHVHLDVRNRKHDLVFKNLVRVQNILRGSQPVGRVENRHCAVNHSDKITDYDGSNRYYVVNPLSYSKHNTIEVRIHEGTTNCEDIYNWVTLLNAIADHKAEIPKNECRFAEDLVDKFDINIPVHAVDYVDRRIERFKSLA